MPSSLPTFLFAQTFSQSSPRIVPVCAAFYFNNYKMKHFKNNQAVVVGHMNHSKMVDPNYRKGKEFSLRVYTPTIESKFLIVKNLQRGLSLKEELVAML